MKDEEPNIIDLTRDEDEDPGRPPASRLLDQCDRTNERESAIRSLPQKSFESGHEVYVLAEDDTHAALPELLACLSHEELKSIGRQMKVTRTGQSVSTYRYVLAFLQADTIYNSVQVCQTQLYLMLPTRQR